MASIGSVDLKIAFRQDRAFIDVTYAVTFDEADEGHRYTELCG